jgi:M-phase inducer tyrosine phosphatase
MMKKSTSVDFALPIPVPDGFYNVLKASSSSPQPLQVPSFHTSHTLIEPKEFVNLAEDPFKRGYNEIVVVDARYPYEYQGGHIQGAINCYNDTQISNLYKIYSKRENVCFVFHCEFSSHRGPNAAEKFRSLDRKENIYPELNFPDLYVLEGGFARFYSDYSCKCEGKYIPMSDQQFVGDGSLSRFHSICHPKPRRVERCFSAEPYCKQLFLDDQTVGQYAHLQKNSM